MIAVRDAYMAAGHSEAEALAVMDRLHKAQKQGGDAVKQVMSEIDAVMKAVKSSTEQATGAAAAGFTGADRAIREATNSILTLGYASDQVRSDMSKPIVTQHVIETINTVGAGSARSHIDAWQGSGLSHEGESYSDWLKSFSADRGGEFTTQQAQEAWSQNKPGGWSDLGIGDFPGTRFAAGTPGLGFMNFGRGTPAVLHGEEAVVPKNRAEDFAMRYGKGEHGEGFNHILNMLVAIERGQRDLDRRIGVAVDDAMTLSRRRR